MYQKHPHTKRMHGYNLDMEGKGTFRLRRPNSDNVQHLYHENYDLLHCEYSLHKSVDDSGQVTHGITGGSIMVILALLPNSNILNWVFDTQKKYNGEVTIDDAHSESLEKVYFEEGRPVNFRFHYEPGTTNNVMLILKINAKRMIIGEAEFNNNW